MTLRRIAVLESEIQSQRLAEILDDMGIPHVIQSHHDSALDGLTQFSAGWGHVEAPPECESEIRRILEELDKGFEGGEDGGGGPGVIGSQVRNSLIQISNDPNYPPAVERIRGLSNV